MIYYADDNDGYKYLLVVIDIFSRYGWVQPLKDKTAKEIVSAFDKILKEGRIPKVYAQMLLKILLLKDFKIMLNPKILLIL